MSRLAGTGVQSRPYLLRLILQTDPSASPRVRCASTDGLPSVDASNRFLYTEGNGTPSGVFIAMMAFLFTTSKFRAEGKSAEDAMIEAGRQRLRPIAMTAIAAIAGMLPLALALGSGSQMLQPLAIAVIGGIVVSIFLSLDITPAVQFYLTEKSSL